MKSLLLTTLVFATASSFADVNESRQAPGRQTAPTAPLTSRQTFAHETTLPKTTLRTTGITKIPPKDSAETTKSETTKSEVTTASRFRPVMKEAESAPKVQAPAPKIQAPSVQSHTPAVQAQTPAAKPALVKTPAPTAPLKQVPVKNPTVAQHPTTPAPAHPAFRPQTPPVVPARPPAIIRPPTPIIVRQVPTPALIQQVVANNRQVMEQNALARAWVDRRAQVYRTAYAAQILASQQRYLAPVYLAPLRVAYQPWVPYGFAVYAYPVRPVAEFYTYFNNPCVSWFYNDYDAEFYRPYYSEYYQRYPDLAVGYNHVGIYFPTEQFINLNVSLSGMPIEYQVHYRRSMNFLSERLIERARGPIGRHEVLVTHYQMLPENRAVIVEGFVDARGQHVPFRALVDLFDANRSRLFAVGAWGENRMPSPEETEDLYYLNDQVGFYGGTLEAPPQY